MSTQDDWNDDQQRVGMSTTTKVLLALAGIGGLCFLLCCGGLFFAGFKIQQFAKNAVKQDARSVREVTAEIIDIDIPDDFEPKQSINAFVMKMVVYQHKTNPGGMLMISEFSNQFPGNQEDQREEMMKAMRESQQADSPVQTGQQTTDSRDIEIDGVKIPFQFMTTVNEADGKSLRQVTGTIPTGRGMVMVMILAPEDILDEEAIEAVLKSIHAPGSDAEKRGPGEEKPAEQLPSEKPATDDLPAEKLPAEKPPEE